MEEHSSHQSNPRTEGQSIVLNPDLLEAAVQDPEEIFKADLSHDEIEHALFEIWKEMGRREQQDELKRTLAAEATDRSCLELVNTEDNHDPTYRDSYWDYWDMFKSDNIVDWRA